MFGGVSLPTMTRRHCIIRTRATQRWPGRILAACVFLVMLFGESPMGIATQLNGLGVKEAQLLQQADRLSSPGAHKQAKEMQSSNNARSLNRALRISSTVSDGAETKFEIGSSLIDRTTR